MNQSQFEQEMFAQESMFGEAEQPEYEFEYEYESSQKNWYYFDAWWRGNDGSVKLLKKHGPWSETEDSAARLYDTMCVDFSNSTRGRTDGKLLTRCYQWFPVTSRWVACKNVVGFKRGMCGSDQSELNEAELTEMEWESPRRPVRRRMMTAPSRGRTITITDPIVICGGKPFSVLDEFVLNSSALRPTHLTKINAIAAEIVARWLKSTPVPSVCLEGHTDTTGKHDYNYRLGLQRAQAVKDALCKALAARARMAGRPDIPAKMTFAVNSLGEDEPLVPARSGAKNRRVHVYLLKEKVPGQTCGTTKPSGDPGLDPCLQQCEREFARCREGASLIDCLRRKKRCERECRGIPV
jgi:outer membrane protein OmpA-like peptidoglycan-associated protein